MLRDVSALYAETQIALLVDEATVSILQTCTFQTSPDGREWTTLFGDLACIRVDLERMGNPSRLLECSIIGTGGVPNSGTRYFRTRLTGDRDERWGIYEVWIRGHSA
ncbi:hypothetical protein EI94DRAFT_1714526 [Lactarius quietus]|nr:hypothetical protein EI94DRAFT_1714526 [Lactarius quietus]